MKRIFITLVFASFGMLLWAQQSSDYIELMRSVIKTEKKVAISDVMQLSEEEADLFWPLYNEYNEKRYVIKTSFVRLIEEFAENYSKMTDELATDYWKRSLKIDTDLLNLEKTYYKKFLKVLDAQKTFRYFQAENKIEALINAQLALEIPLLETIE
ncbi:MAG: hypothetical protein U9R60_07290 [Bacteroidota bacterium]|nr:hypothetical protein [Bacteroidota bacterium]